MTTASSNRATAVCPITPRFHTIFWNAKKMARASRSIARADSAEAMIRAANNIRLGAVKPPRYVRLRKQDKPFFLDVIASRSRDEWTDADVVVAAQLARCQADIESESQALDAEGNVLKVERGAATINPRFELVAQLVRREMALMRTLRMGGRVAGDARDLAGIRRLERQARQVEHDLRREKADGDPLLA